MIDGNIPVFLQKLRMTTDRNLFEKI